MTQAANFFMKLALLMREKTIMRIHISYQGVEKKSKKLLTKFFRKQAEKLEKKLGSLTQHDVSIKATLQKHSKKPVYRFGVNLHLLHKIVSADEEGDDPFTVIKKVFKELARQAQRYKSRLKNEHLWKRKVRRKQLKSVKALSEMAEETGSTVQTEAHAANWFDDISPYLDDLYDFAVREITYLQASDDLRPGDILPDELVDAVVVLAYEKEQERPKELDIRAWLHQLAIDLLDAEIERSQQRRKTISLETTIEDEEIDRTLYEFYQPDDVLLLEDLIGTSEQLPEIEMQLTSEERGKVHQDIAHLPRIWRRAALLHYTAGFSREAVAAILSLETAQVRDLLAAVARFLDDHQASSGGIVIESVFTVCKKTYPAPLYTELQTKFKGENNE